MSRTYKSKPYSYFRSIRNIRPEYKDPELVELGYCPRARHKRELSSWDDIPYSSNCRYYFK